MRRILRVSERVGPALAVGVGDQAGDERLLLPVGVETRGEGVEPAIQETAPLGIGSQEGGIVVGDARLALLVEGDKSLPD